MQILKEENTIKNFLEGLDLFTNQRLNEIEEKVKEIIEEVRTNKDSAIVNYTKLFDSPDFDLNDLIVKDEEIEQAYLECKKEDMEFISALEVAYKNIYEYHSKQKEESWFFSKDGSILGQIIRPLERVGIYVPGGKGAYPSTVLMNCVPASVAGVKDIVMVCPPSKDKRINKYVLAAAKICGIRKVFKVGGAQAIAALTFGTNLIPRVDKIVGPGNIYVAVAKKLLFGYVDIDSVAGPSEILIIADESAKPKYISADLLSQAEHDTMAKSILVTTSEKLALDVKTQVEKMLKEYTNPVAEQSIRDNGVIIVVDNIERAIEIANLISPEHLQLNCKDPDEVFFKIKNAGAIFVGDYSPEPIGDYIAGPNHVLPTAGTARFFSPLGVYDFVKRISIIKYSREEFSKESHYAINIAQKEGFLFHANSLKVRFEDV